MATQLRKECRNSWPDLLSLYFFKYKCKCAVDLLTGVKWAPFSFLDLRPQYFEVIATMDVIIPANPADRAQSMNTNEQLMINILKVLQKRGIHVPLIFDLWLSPWSLLHQWFQHMKSMNPTQHNSSGVFPSIINYFSSAHKFTFLILHLIKSIKYKGIKQNDWLFYHMKSWLS